MQDKNTKQRIIEVATELFAQNGFAGASTREICKRANTNIGMISYYFGSKEDLYKQILNNIAGKIIENVKVKVGASEAPDDFSKLTKEEKIQLLIKIIRSFIDYFYSDNISTAELSLAVHEQITSNIDINPIGYKILKRLLASIYERDENDKEIIFRSVMLAGQMNSARILSQFSLKQLNQEKYTPEDIELIKEIAIEQTLSILKNTELK